MVQYAYPHMMPPRKVCAGIDEALARPRDRTKLHPNIYGDGHASERIVTVLEGE